jgi:hypothetical protein
MRTGFSGKKFFARTFFGVIFSFNVSAGCAPSFTMGGTWMLYPPSQWSDIATSCSLTLNPNGTIKSGVCNTLGNGTDTSRGVGVAAVTAGSFSVSAACVVTGSITLESGRSLTLESARLDISRNTLMGIARDNAPSLGQILMLRY